MTFEIATSLLNTRGRHLRRLQSRPNRHHRRLPPRNVSLLRQSHNRTHRRRKHQHPLLWPKSQTPRNIALQEHRERDRGKSERRGWYAADGSGRVCREGRGGRAGGEDVADLEGRVCECGAVYGGVVPGVGVGECLMKGCGGLG